MPVEIDSNPVWEKLIERSGGSAFGWAEFVGTALFDPLLGYYRKAEKRVGGEGADFYTSVSLKEKVFSGLILAAAKKMLSDAGENPDCFEFYEIGAEPETQIIEGSKTARIGDIQASDARTYAGHRVQGFPIPYHDSGAAAHATGTMRRRFPWLSSLRDRSLFPGRSTGRLDNGDRSGLELSPGAEGA